jgi:hypothetical protein
MRRSLVITALRANTASNNSYLVFEIIVEQ